MAKRSKRKKNSPKKAREKPAPIFESLPKAPSVPSWKVVLRALLIVVTGLWVYFPVLHGGWLWDDDYLLSQSPLVQDPEGLWNIWFNPTTLIDYFPLTVSIEWLEWQIWPDNTFCYHLTSLLCHLSSALLVWHLLSKFGLRLAWLGGLLFAIHPVMVESVAWMAELKNTLSMPPFLLAACAWIDYERRGKLEDYFLALGLFLIAMLCKTTMVMFPFIILLFAWWKRGRIGWIDLRNSIPFFAISLALGLTLVALLRHGIGEETIPLGGLLSRLACGGLSIAFYFSRCFLPVDLLPIYPQWEINPPSLIQFLPWAVFAWAIHWLWTRQQPWARHVLLGLGFFVLNLLPFVGFHIISFMRFTWVMDHFLYLPILGLLGVVIAGMDHLDKQFSTATQPYRIAALAIVLTLLTIGSHRYAKIFRSQIDLWTYESKNSPDMWVAYNNLGLALASEGNRGKLIEAEKSYLTALRINPGYPEAHNNYGIALYDLGNSSEAIEQFKLALKYCPDMSSAQGNLANAEAAQMAAPAPAQK
jgi:hypothetical protein